MIFNAYSDGFVAIGEREAPCALGPTGVIDAEDKREGDGATPLGVWPIRRVLYRPDRIERPVTKLPTQPIRAYDGWCDEPADAAYNRAVTLPYPTSAERMWRADELYDVVAILGHNDDPPVPGMGSAIFLHCAKPGYPPTQGCVALARADLLDLLALAAPGDALAVVAR